MLEFTTKKFKDHAVVTYACGCGCKPMAHYTAGSENSASEHCCCGNVHFAGPNAVEDIQGYLAQRRTEGLDEGLAHSMGVTESKLPTGEVVPVAYGIAYVAGEEAPETHGFPS